MIREEMKLESGIKCHMFKLPSAMLKNVIDVIHVHEIEVFVAS